MDLSTITSNVRTRLDDTVATYLWADAELELFANEAYEQAVVRMGGILDSDTASICTIAVTATDGTYTLDDKILHVERAKLTSQDSPLKETGVYELDRYNADWESSSEAPHSYTEDLNRHEIRLYPIPTANDTLNLTVRRRPLTLMALSTDTPSDIPTHMHPGLLHWIMYLAYLKQDADTESGRAVMFRDLFTQYFGPIKSWNAQEHERDYRQKSVNFNYFA